MESLKILKKFYKSKKIFITGHTGFKGTWLSIILNYLEAKVYGYALSPKKESLFKLTKIKKKYPLILTVILEITINSKKK